MIYPLSLYNLSNLIIDFWTYSSTVSPLNWACPPWSHEGNILAPWATCEQCKVQRMGWMVRNGSWHTWATPTHKHVGAIACKAKRICTGSMPSCGVTRGRNDTRIVGTWMGCLRQRRQRDEHNLVSPTCTSATTRVMCRQIWVRHVLASGWAWARCGLLQPKIQWADASHE